MLAVLLAAGCATAPPAPRPGASSIPPILPPDSDWRDVPRTPFGSRLEQLHLALHEVLLFRDRDETGALSPAQRECYAPEGAARRFLGREVERELICLRAGGVDSFELSVPLPAADAAALFAGYCEAWLKGPTVPLAQGARQCSGSDPRGIAFEASLDTAGDGEDAALQIVVHDNHSTASP